MLPKHSVVKPSTTYVIDKLVADDSYDKINSLFLKQYYNIQYYYSVCQKTDFWKLIGIVGLKINLSRIKCVGSHLTSKPINMPN